MSDTDKRFNLDQVFKLVCVQKSSRWFRVGVFVRWSLSERKKKKKKQDLWIINYLCTGLDNPLPSQIMGYEGLIGELQARCGRGVSGRQLEQQVTHIFIVSETCSELFLQSAPPSICCNSITSLHYK